MDNIVDKDDWSELAMKKMIIALLAGIILLSFGSCAEADVEYSYSIKDALKISAYLLDENLTEDDMWVLTEDGVLVFNRDETIFNLERLEQNKIRTMAPIGAIKKEWIGRGLTLFVEFDGIIEVAAENEDMELMYLAGKVYGYSVKFTIEGFVNACLLVDEQIGMQRGGSFGAEGYVGTFGFGAEVGTERYLTVNAYSFENEETPIIRAQLKLVLIEDRIENLNGNKGFSHSFYSIQLVSYEYSDRYRFLDEIWDEEDE